MELPADMEIAAVADLAMQFDDWLLGTYRQLAEESEVPELRELFDALIEQQLGEKRQLAKNLNELADI
jgi:predicted RNA-binding Zn ribbon-like protein